MKKFFLKFFASPKRALFAATVGRLRKFFASPKSAAAVPGQDANLPPELRGKIFEAAATEIDDPVLSVAKSVFGIKRLFPWQRLVIGNILDAAADSTAGLFGFANNSGQDQNAPRDQNSSQDQNAVAPLGLASNCSQDQNAPGASLACVQSSSCGDFTDAFCMGRQIVLLPTGAGKSMCFLLPAVMLPGPTLVFYPLLALMADQKRRLEQNGIECVVFRGGQSQEEREENFRRLEAGAKVILANPEVLQGGGLLARLKNAGISHIAIDEAHCVAEWGDTFRPAYLTLGKIIEDLGVPLVTAFTATASPTVLERVSQVLFGGLVHVVRGESDRPNIHYSVQYAWAKKKAALRLAATEQKPMIIFCGTRAKSEDMARELCESLGSDKVKFYHAGLSRDEKAAVEKWFFPKSDAVLCCTCAFGMGVDKADIRTVIHLEPSPTAEAYIQEAGRGGRDRKVANAILLWSRADSMNFEKFALGSRERVLKKFAEAKSCRRQVLLDALGGEQAICAGCDICQGQKTARQNGAAWISPSVFDASDACLVHKFVRKNRNYYSKNKVVQFTLQKLNAIDRKIFGVNVWDSSDIKEILEQLQQSGSVYDAGFLWNGNLAAEKDISSPPRRHPLCLHPRPLFARLPSWRELARARVCGALDAAAFLHSARQKKQSSSKELSPPPQ